MIILNHSLPYTVLAIGKVLNEFIMLYLYTIVVLWGGESVGVIYPIESKFSSVCAHLYPTYH